MTSETRQVMDYPVHIFWSEADGGYIADIPDLACCSAFGNTLEEALRQVALAKEAWLDAARAEGRPLPEPRYRPVI
jgi:predicted RNase H-like HicB family nuclease